MESEEGSGCSERSGQESVGTDDPSTAEFVAYQWVI